jgi:hypothetical protein
MLTPERVLVAGGVHSNRAHDRGRSRDYLSAFGKMASAHGP